MNNDIIEKLLKCGYDKWSKILPKDISLGNILDHLEIDNHIIKVGFYSNEILKLESHKCNICKEYFPIMFNKKSAKFFAKKCPCVKNKSVIEMYISYFGKEKGEQFFKDCNIKRTSKFQNTTKYWENMGCTKDTALFEVKKVQKERSKCNIKRLEKIPKNKRTGRQYLYWVDRGYTEDEAKEKVKTIQISNGYQYYKDKYGSDGEDMQIERNKKWRDALYSNNDMEHINKLKAFTTEDYKEKYGEEKYLIQRKNKIEKTLETKYRKNIFSRNSTDKKKYLSTVSMFTRLSKKYYMSAINPNNLEISHKTNHIDHIYSVSSGFINEIPPHIIGSPINLRTIDWHENISKSSKCHITIFELLARYYQFVYEDNKYIKMLGGI